MSVGPGSLLSDRYRIVDELGRGAMGVVYRAEHTLLGRLVAIKVLQLPGAELLARFQREARLLARIDHDNVCAATDFGLTPDGDFFLVMEHLEGENMGDVLIRDGRIPVSRAIPIFRQVAEGLAHCHEAGVIHRDLKHDNLMLVRAPGAPREQVKILDFGVAISVRPDPGTARLTQTGVILGTPAFMSPEQATGGDLDARSDLYAVGVMIYEAVTGLNPFDADSTVKVLAAQVHHRPPPMSEAAPDLDIPEALDVIVARLMEKDPAARVQTARELAAHLAALERRDQPTVALAPLHAPRPPPAERGGPPARRRLVPLALLALALLVAGVLAWVAGGGAAPGPESPTAAPIASPPVGGATAGETPGPLRVIEHVVAQDVRDRDPVGVATRFPVDVGRVYCFLVILNEGPRREVTVAWRHGDEERGRTELRVGRSEGWRTWAVTRIPPARSGPWRCDVLAADGQLLGSRPFTVGP